jgi:hypothetical protein
MGFDGWQLPRGFALDDEEIVVLEEASLPALRIPLLGEDRLRALARKLREARENVLAGLPVRRIVRSLDSVARRFLSPDDPLRAEALENLGAHARLSEPMARRVLEGMVPDWTQRRLEVLLRSDFHDPEVLDGPRSSPSGGQIRALGHPLTFHMGAGTVPGVAVTSMVRALLVKSAVLLKPGRGDVVLPCLFARGLLEEAPEVAEAVAVLYWPRGAVEGEAAVEEADLVVVYGGDETVGTLRKSMPASTPLVAFRHRMGVVYVGLGEGGEDIDGEIAAAARAVALFDQRGCVSPHAFLVARGGEVEPDEWARGLAAELEGLERTLPSGPLGPEDASSLAQVRGAGELEAAAGRGEVFHGGSQSPWTVIYQPAGSVEASCLNRTVRVIAVEGVREAEALLRPWAPYLQTVGVARLGREREKVLESFARLGVSRVTGLGGIPWPPAWWHEDGVDPLRSLVRWMDIEDDGSD